MSDQSIRKRANTANLIESIAKVKTIVAAASMPMSDSGSAAIRMPPAARPLSRSKKGPRPNWRPGPKCWLSEFLGEEDEPGKRSSFYQLRRHSTRVALIWINLRNFLARINASVWHTGAMMDLKEAIYTRRAVRDFTAESVDDKTIRALIDAAVQAPSAVNQQPCSFCVVRDKAVLTKISRESKAFMVRSTPVGLMSHHFQQILNEANFDILYHAPVLIVISAVADIPWAVEDCALAAENLMLAARGAGLGTCWIGFAQGWLGTPEGKALLKIPAAYRPCAPIILGHAKSEPSPVPRKAPEISWIGP